MHTKSSKYYTKFRETGKTFKLVNTISASMFQSIKEKKKIILDKQIFTHKTLKHIKPVNKTFLGYASEYDELVNKER